MTYCGQWGSSKHVFTRKRHPWVSLGICADNWCLGLRTYGLPALAPLLLEHEDPAPSWGIRLPRGPAPARSAARPSGLWTLSGLASPWPSVLQPGPAILGSDTPGAGGGYGLWPQPVQRHVPALRTANGSSDVGYCARGSRRIQLPPFFRKAKGTTRRQPRRCHGRHGTRLASGLPPSGTFP